jgi:hypothetical protein
MGGPKELEDLGPWWEWGVSGQQGVDEGCETENLSHWTKACVPKPMLVELLAIQSYYDQCIVTLKYKKTIVSIF